MKNEYKIDITEENRKLMLLDLAKGTRTISEMLSNGFAQLVDMMAGSNNLTDGVKLNDLQKKFTPFLEEVNNIKLTANADGFSEQLLNELLKISVIQQEILTQVVSLTAVSRATMGLDDGGLLGSFGVVRADINEHFTRSYLDLTAKMLTKYGNK